MEVMMRIGPMLALLAVIALTGCNTAATTEEEILFGTADTAVFVGDFANIVFWEIPKFLVWTTPKAVLYDLPRAGILALSGASANVGSMMDLLSDPNLPDEDVVRTTRELRRATGLPLRGRGAWLAWWRDNSDVPDGRWREVFVNRQVDLLVSPDYFERAAAIGHLQEMFGTSLNYDAKLGPAALEDAAARWRARVGED